MASTWSRRPWTTPFVSPRKMNRTTSSSPLRWQLKVFAWKKFKLPQTFYDCFLVFRFAGWFSCGAQHSGVGHQQSHSIVSQCCCTSFITMFHDWNDFSLFSIVFIIVELHQCQSWFPTKRMCDFSRWQRSKFWFLKLIFAFFKKIVSIFFSSTKGCCR